MRLPAPTSALTPLLLAGALVGGLAAPAPANAAITITPGQSWASVLASAPAGSTVTLANGSHGTQTLTSKDYKGIKLVGASRSGVKVTSVYLKDVSNLTLESMRFEPAGSVGGVRMGFATKNVVISKVDVVPLAGATGPGFDIARGNAVAPQDVTITDSTYNGAGTTGTSARAVRIWAGNVPQSQWPTRITITKSSLSRAAADLVQVGGGKDVTISDSALFDTQSNADHNDGVQSYGSNGLVVSGNRFNHSGAYDGNDQAVIVGHAPPGNDYLKVTNTTIKDNTLTRWSGQGIVLSGTSTTSVTGNVVSSFGTAGSSFVLGSNGYGYTNTGLTLSGNTFAKVTDATAR
jgi:parallel beta-helix repeat protein